jgi:CRISPR-associated endoribonuclease Cas6
LDQVLSIAPDGTSEEGQRVETVYSGKDKVLKSSYKIVGVEDLLLFDPSILTLHLVFLTPTRVKFDGTLCPRAEFHILFRNLLRRISLVSYFHCGEELHLDFKALIEKSREIKSTKSDLKWFDWERYSNRQETTMKMGGFKGSVTFEGDLGLFWPFLILGEYIHVGKGTSFGLGKYEIVRDWL